MEVHTEIFFIAMHFNPAVIAGRAHAALHRQNPSC